MKGFTLFVAGYFVILSTLYFQLFLKAKNHTSNAMPQEIISKPTNSTQQQELRNQFFYIFAAHPVAVAQLVRASDCGSEGRRFEPGHPPKRLKEGFPDFSLFNLKT